MGGFLTFVVIVIGVVWLFRYLRQREQAKFRDSDMRTLHELTSSDPKLRKQTADSVESLASLPPQLKVVAEQAIADKAAEGRGASLRASALDEIHANVLRLLEELLGDRYRIFVNKPVVDFVRLEKGDGDLLGKTVSFVACDPQDFSVVFALVLRGAGQVEMSKYQFLEEIFAEVEVPLAAVPLMPNLSRAEIEEQLAGLTPSPLSSKGSG